MVSLIKQAINHCHENSRYDTGSGGRSIRSIMDFRSVRISCGRRFGHTEVALKLMNDFPLSILIKSTEDARRRSFKDFISEYHADPDTKRRFVCSCDLEVTNPVLGIELAIIDDCNGYDQADLNRILASLDYNNAKLIYIMLE